MEYVNSLLPSGLPSHDLILKKGVPLMLLRNLQPLAGLCNGTRLIFREVSSDGRLMHCSIVKDGVSREVAIPRITLRPGEKEYPFEWSRRQFPVRAAFASTINKAQGESLKRIGIWLPEPVFGHGQLYVALSRVGAPEWVTIAIRPREGEPANQTRNVVFQEVLAAVTTAAGPGLQPVMETGEDVLPVDDITEWLQTDGVGGDAESELDPEEAGALRMRPRQRQVERPRSVRLSRSPAREEMPPPPTVPRPMAPLRQRPLCEYELIREENIAQREAEYLRIFGEPMSSSHGQFGWLEETE